MYTLDYEKIAKKIKLARKAANLTQAELAERIDVSTNAIAKLENNLMTVSLQTLINIVNVLNLDLNYLLQDEQISSAEQNGLDSFFESLIRGLSPQEKCFIIHVINGLKIYNASEQ